MKVEVVVKEIHAKTTTSNDNTLFNDRDEVFLSVAGAIPQGRIELPRISPVAPEDYYGLTAGQSAQDIHLWTGELEFNERAAFAVVVVEQDNHQLDSIINGVTSAAALIGGLFLEDATLLASGAAGLAAAGAELVDSISSSGNDIIGGFNIIVENLAGQISARWSNGSDTQLIRSSNTSADFEATGAGSEYTIHVEARTGQALTVAHRPPPLPDLDTDTGREKPPVPPDQLPR
jgi:hypothetical protein